MTAEQTIAKEIEAARDAARLRRRLAAEAAEAASANVPAPLTHVAINVSTAGNHTLVAGNSQTQIAVYELLLWNVTQQDLELLDGTDSLTGPLNSFPAQFGILLPNVGEPRWLLRAGNSLVLSLGSAAQVSGYVLYRREDV